MKYLILILVITFKLYTQDYWQQTNGPFGGSSYQLTKAPNGDIYAAAGYNGIYRSTDNGNTWIKLNWDEVSLNFLQAYYIYAAPNGYIYAGGGGTIIAGPMPLPNQGIFRSTDNGTTWQKVCDTGNRRAVEFTVTANGYIFAAALRNSSDFIPPGGVYKSTNNGANWIYTELFYLVGEGISSIASEDNGYLYGSEIDHPSSHSWSSSDYGNTWIRNPNLQTAQFVVKKSNGYVFARKTTGVLRSTDHGLNWVNVSSSSFSGCDKIWMDEAENLYVSANNSLYKSSNNGNSWVNLVFTFPANFNNLLVEQGNIFYSCVNHDFVKRTSNFGTNWDILQTGVINSNITGIAVDRTGNIYSVRKPTANLYKSSDNGFSWQQLTIPSGTGLMDFVAADSNDNIFIANSTALYRSTDSGNSWNQAGNGLTSLNFYTFCAGLDGNLYASTTDTASGIFKSTNGGLNWSSIGLPNKIQKMVVSQLGEVYAVQINQNGSIYNYKLYKTTNNGTNWLTIRSSSGTVANISYNSFNDNIYITEASSGFLRSGDGGQNWINVNNGITHSGYNTCLVNTNGNLIAVAYQNGSGTNSGNHFYESTNNGSSWSSIRSGWPVSNTFITSVIIGPNGYLYSGTYKYQVGDQGHLGIWRSATSSNTFIVTGTVRYQDNNQPVTSGYVKAVKSFNGQQVTLDSAGIQQNGTYILTKVPQDSTDLIAFQNDEEDNYFVPTFYQSAVNWQESNTLYPTGNLNNIDISVQRMNASLSSGKITGKVFGGTADYFTIKDARIYAKLNGSYKGYSISVSNGVYSVDSIPNGTYDLMCDMIGYWPQTQTVTFNGGTLQNVDFYLNGFLIPVENISNVIPKNYKLYQNYPNPFNPVTTFRFDIPKNLVIKLVIYDLLGKVVGTLVDKNLTAGSYKVSWDAGRYSSGVYFYRLRAGDFTETKKLVIIK